MSFEYSVDLPLNQAPSDGEAELVARAVGGDHEAYAALGRLYERVA